MLEKNGHVEEHGPMGLGRGELFALVMVSHLGTQYKPLPQRSHAQITRIPARSDRMRCTVLALVMSENRAPRENGAGDDLSALSSADVRVQRAALLTAELAEICATNMFIL